MVLDQEKTRWSLNLQSWRELELMDRIFSWKNVVRREMTVIKVGEYIRVVKGWWSQTSQSMVVVVMVV